jgi:hypothetical protein
MELLQLKLTVICHFIAKVMSCSRIKVWARGGDERRETGEGGFHLAGFVSLARRPRYSFPLATPASIGLVPLTRPTTSTWAFFHLPNSKHIPDHHRPLRTTISGTRHLYISRLSFHPPIAIFHRPKRTASARNRTRGNRISCTSTLPSALPVPPPLPLHLISRSCLLSIPRLHRDNSD